MAKAALRRHNAWRASLLGEANPAASATLASFLGNLTVMQVPTADAVALQRQADCSLALANYSYNGFSSSRNSSTPGYEKTLNANSFLGTTPDLFPKGCVDSTLGLNGRETVYLGKAPNGDQLIAVALNNGIGTASLQSNGTLTASVTLTTDKPPFSIASADLNNDGNPDLVSFNTDGSNTSVTIFLGTAGGGYGTGTTIQLTGVAQFGAVADVNGDGAPDIVVNIGSSSLAVLINNGNGTFKAPQSVSPAGGTFSNSDTMLIADVNGDKANDLIFANGQIFLGKGDGATFTLVTGTTFPRPSNPSNQFAPGIVAADFNKDNKLDLAIDDGTTIRTYTGNGNGTFNVGPAYAEIGSRGYLLATDLDGDGNVDLITGHSGPGLYSGDDFNQNETYAILGAGDGTFSGAPSLPAAYNGTNLIDLNGDGRPDLVGWTSNLAQASAITTYLTGANGIPVAGPSFEAVAALDSLVVGAFNTNSNATPGLIYLDSNPNGQTFYVSTGTGDGSFTSSSTFLVPSLVPSGQDIDKQITALQVADINHDGKSDLIYCFYDIDGATNTYYEGFAVQLGNGGGTFQAPKVTVTYSGSSQPQVAFSNMLANVTDVTGDGFPDVFIIEPTAIVNTVLQHQVQLWVGNGDGTFKSPNTIVLTGNVNAPNVSLGLGFPFAFADLNGDGKIDVVASGSSSDGTTPTVAIALGNGDGTFQPATTFTLEGSGYAGSPALAKFTGSGKLDLFVAGSIEGSGGIFPGNGGGTFQSISNGDGTVSAVDLVPLSLGVGAAIGVDLNNDGVPDALVGNVVLISKASATPPATAPTTTTLDSTQNPSTVGSPVSFTAFVTSATAGTITGTVTFFNGSTQLGTTSVGPNGIAIFAPQAPLTLGTHSITAQFGGSPTFAASTSAVLSQVVNPTGNAATTTTLTSSLNPSTSGAPVTYTASVTSTTSGTITGWLSISDGTVSGLTHLGPSESANLTTSYGFPGTRSVTAQYLGDATYAPSSAPTLSQVVNAAGTAATTTSLTSSPNPSTAGSGVTFTAIVTSSAPGTISGSISFYDGLLLLDTPITMTGNLATYTNTGFAPGTHTITAKYSGNANYAPSTSTPVSQVVNAAPTLPSMTSLSPSTTSAVSGTNITFTATVTASAIAGKNSQAATAVTGTVAFYDGSTQLGTGSVGAGGVATYATSTLAVGSHSITAQYGGDSNYEASASPAVQITITTIAGTFTLAANPSSLTVTKSQGGTSTISVTPTGGFNQAVALTCSGLPSGFSCTFGPPTVTPNGAPATSTLTITDGLVPGGSRRPIAAMSPAGAAGSRGGGSAVRVAPSRTSVFALAFAGQLALLGLLFERRKRVLVYAAGRVAFALLICAITVTFMAGCSGGGGTQMVSITVTGTAGTQIASTTITATVPDK